LCQQALPEFGLPLGPPVSEAAALNRQEEHGSGMSPRAHSGQSGGITPTFPLRVNAYASLTPRACMARCECLLALWLLHGDALGASDGDPSARAGAAATAAAGSTGSEGVAGSGAAASGFAASGGRHRKSGAPVEAETAAPPVSFLDDERLAVLQQGGTAFYLACGARTQP